jgi:hypothetical protein
MNRAPPLLWRQAESLHGLDREGRGQMGLAHSNNIFYFYSELIQNSIQI